MPRRPHVSQDELTPLVVSQLFQEAQKRGLAVPGGQQDYSKYRDDPVAFVRKELHFFPWSKQIQILEALRDGSRVSVRSSHGPGKTAIAAACSLWFSLSRPNSIVLSTAPVKRQVEEQLWREIRGHHARCKLPGRCLTTRLELGDQWYALGLSTDEPDRFTGFHARDILLICDEAAGIPQSIYDAAEGILTTAGAKLLLIGNPTSNSGRFYDTHHSQRELWKTIDISTFDTPNYTGEPVPPEVAAHLPYKGWAEEKAIEWGADSPMYQVRVLGQFPTQSDDSLISLQWILDAVARDAAALAPPQAPEDERDPTAPVGVWQKKTRIERGRRRTVIDETDVEVGVDVARQGSCETVCYARKGPLILGMDAWRSPDLMATTGRIKAFGERLGARVYRVDATGMGSGVADRLKEQGVPVEYCFVGQSARDRERFALKRDEIWWSLRERFRSGEIGGLTDEKTQAQLSAIRYQYDSRGKIKVESKDEMSGRGLQSPDRADALGLAFIPTTRPAKIVRKANRRELYGYA